jgi:hypothetical protein
MKLILRPAMPMAWTSNDAVRCTMLSSNTYGRRLDTTWTQTEYNVPHLAEVESRLHSSVVEFLKGALAVSNFPDEPCENRFFYYCDDLSPAEVMFDDYELYRGDGVNRITLYLAGGFKEESRDGLVYIIHET